MDSLPPKIEQSDRRQGKRIKVNSLALLSTDERARTTRLVNVSAGGAMVGPVFGVDVGDTATLNVPGYGKITGRVVRMTDDNYAGICFSPDPDFHALCEERGDELLEMISAEQMAFQNPYLARIGASS